MNKSNFRKNILLVLFILIFIFIYLVFLIYVYIIPYKYNVSILILIGFSILIFSIMLSVILKHDNFGDFSFQIKIPSENMIKIILLLLISFALLFLPSIKSRMTIIIWNRVGPLNYLRAIFILVGCSILPGSNIYNIFLSKTNLHEKFKIEPFFLKLTFYPLFSFSYIGISVLFLDQAGLARMYFEPVLFFFILILYILDLIIQKIRKIEINVKFGKIDVSGYTLLILLISFGYLVISLGIHMGVHYLVLGDSWAGIIYSDSIGRQNTNIIEFGNKYLYYPIFWSYVSFGFSVFSGLPYININALLAPFSYLYVTSVYLLMRALLIDYKNKYALFSTILVSTFSGLFYISENLIGGKMSGIIIVESFIYKSYAYLLFILAIALFIIIIKTSEHDDTEKRSVFKSPEIKILFVVALFLVLCFMTYALPLLIGLVFIIFYCILNNDNLEKNFRYWLIFLLFFSLIFIVFDILMSFYLSSSMIFLISWFFPVEFFALIMSIIPSAVLVYSFLFFFITISKIIQKLYFRHVIKKKKFLKIEVKMIFKIVLIIFSILLGFEIFNLILKEIFKDVKLDEDFIFFYYIDLIFSNIGLVGILAIYLSYFCYTTERKLFFILLSWIAISFLIGSSLIFYMWLKNPSIFLKAITESDQFLMSFWFSRVWIYSIFPLSIFCYMGIIKLVKKLKNNSNFEFIFRKKNLEILLKYSSISLLFYLFCSNFFLAGLSSGNSNNRIKEEEIEIIGWMSENISPDSNILLYKYNYPFEIGIFTAVNGYIFYFNRIFDKTNNQTERLEEIDDLKDRDIEYFLISEDSFLEHTNRSSFTRNYLIPNFYNETLKEFDNYIIYYAPYFD